MDEKFIQDFQKLSLRVTSLESENTYLKSALMYSNQRDPRESVMRPRGHSRVWVHHVNLVQERAKNGPFVVKVAKLPCVPRLLGVRPGTNADSLEMDFMAWEFDDWRRFTHTYAFVPVRDGKFPLEVQGKVIVTSEYSHVEIADAGRYYVFTVKETLADPGNVKRKPLR